MGVGKSSVSKELAQKLSYKFYDLDKIIEKESKLEISKIFENLGEEKFREIESNVLENFVLQNENFVLALGGGTLDNSKNLKFVQNFGKLIFLENSFEILWERIKFSNRPLIKKGKNFCQKLFSERQKIYTNSSIQIQCFQKSVSEVTNEIFLNFSAK